MWPGIHPRVGLPLVLGFYACYGWLLSARHPGRSGWWWAFTGVFVLGAAVTAFRQWRRQAQIADALAGRAEPDPALAREVDAVARRVDDSGRWQTWSVVAVVVGVAVLALPAALRHEAWSAVVPFAGLAVQAVVALFLLRRRRDQVSRWLTERPREPDWRSVPPS